MSNSNNFITRSFCPLCSSSNHVHIHTTNYDNESLRSYLEFAYSKVGSIEMNYLSNAKYILRQCQECELIYQVEIPDDNLMHRLYEVWIDPEITYENHRRDDGLDYHCANAKEITSMIAFFNRSPKDIEFCDFGMGWGKWALMAKAFGVNITGVELSEYRVNKAQENGIQVVDGEKLSDHNFDLINTEQVFEHLPDPLETLNSLKLSLKPYGLIKISVPNVRNIKKRIRSINWEPDQANVSKNMPVAPLEHINCYSRKSMLKLAELAGMREVKIPVLLQYSYTNNWRGTKNKMINLALPLYRNILEKQNYMFLGLKP